MKKFFFLSLVIFFFSFSLKSQTVDSIKVEQSGDFIKIRYKILNTTPDQVYRVKVLCSINGGMNTEIRSISGDVGDMVAGGKPEYWVVWDVLKDVEELKSAEFIVRAELVKGTLTNNTKKGRAKNKFYVQIIGEAPPGLPGLRIGYSGAWGISLSYAGGNYKSINQYVDNVSTDITKRLVNINKFQMHLFGGFSAAQLRIRHVDPEDDVLSFFGPDFGLLMNIRKFSISLHCSYFGNQGKVPVGAEIDHFLGGVGLGIRF